MTWSANRLGGSFNGGMRGMGSEAGIVLRTVVSVEESRCDRSRHDNGEKQNRPRVCLNYCVRMIK
jgi:hypothetical protein